MKQLLLAAMCGSFLFAGCTSVDMSTYQYEVGQVVQRCTSGELGMVLEKGSFEKFYRVRFGANEPKNYLEIELCEAER